MPSLFRQYFANLFCEPIKGSATEIFGPWLGSRGLYALAIPSVFCEPIKGSATYLTYGFSKQTPKHSVLPMSLPS